MPIFEIFHEILIIALLMIISQYRRNPNCLAKLFMKFYIPQGKETKAYIIQS